MNNRIQPRQSLLARSQTLLEKAQGLNAAGKTGSTGARAALAHAKCSVGNGASREKAQSAGASIKGLLTSLSNALKTVLYSPAALVKTLQSYAMRPGRADGDLSPKKALAQVSRRADSSAESVRSFLNANAVTKDAFRGLRDTVAPASTPWQALGREADDAFTDLKGEGKGLIKDVKNFFKDL